jgi:hypothetical protein
MFLSPVVEQSAGQDGHGPMAVGERKTNQVDSFGCHAPLGEKWQETIERPFVSEFIILNGNGHFF